MSCDNRAGLNLSETRPTITTSGDELRLNGFWVQLLHHRFPGTAITAQVPRNQPGTIPTLGLYAEVDLDELNRTESHGR